MRREAIELLAVGSLDKSRAALTACLAAGQPDEVQAAVHDLRGTTEFITDTAVHPLIRVVAVGRGLKKGISVASSLGRKRE